MITSLSAINADVLQISISLSSFQDMLVNANNHLLKDIMQTIESIFFISKQSSLSQLVHLLFTSAECRYQKVPYYCYILKTVYETHRFEEVISEIKRALLHSFIQPATIHNSRCFFLRCCMKEGILTPKEIVDTIYKFFQMRPSNPDRLIYSFCWFCPEIELLNKELYDIVLSALMRNVETGMTISMYANFLRILEPLKANNWQIYHQCVQYGFNPDRYAIIICRDEVDILKSEIEKNHFNANGYLIPDCVFDCTRMMSESKPSLLQVSAYFGSMKCFDYLLSFGGDCKYVADQQKTLLMFAIAGGNLPMAEKIIKIEKDKNNGKFNMNKVFETAARFHQNEVFQYLLENTKQGGSMTLERETYQMVLNDCVISNNMSLLIKCLEKGANINHSDCYNIHH